MKSLKSNGGFVKMSADDEWMGVDDTELQYPGVETCITVTCLMSNKLVGCHLYHYWNNPSHTQVHHDKCITKFVNKVKEHGLVKAVYIIGNTAHWKDHLPTLEKQLFAKLGYVGVIGGSNPPDCCGNLAVTLDKPVNLKFTIDGKEVVLATAKHDKDS